MNALRSGVVALGGICMLVPAGVGRAEEEAPAERPNVLVISIDTLRADHLSFLGYERKTSPHLDALAARSVVFEDAHSASSWTPPGAASFLTGLHPIRHGMVGGPVRIHEEATTLAQTLSAAGYRTRAVVQNAWFAAEFGWSRGFDEYQHHDFIGNPLCTPEIEADVAAWLAQPSEKPFLLWLNYFAPHCPYDPHEPWTARYSPREYSKWFKAIEFVEMERFKGRILLPRDLDRLVALYDGEINFVDRHVGRVLSALDAAGLRERTLVVLVSDHGEEFKDHGSLGHYRTLHTELTHVPFLISLPDQQKALRVTRPVSTVDLVPTLRAVLGLPALEGLDGQSLLHVAKTKEGAVASRLGRFDVRRESPYVFSFRYAQGYEAFDAGKRLRERGEGDADLVANPERRRFAHVFSVRDERYTLLCHTGKVDLEASKAIDGRFSRADDALFLTLGLHYRYELFDRQDDPREQNDVADDHLDVCKRLATVLRGEFRRRANRLPFDAGGRVTGPNRVPVSPEVGDALDGLGYK